MNKFNNIFGQILDLFPRAEFYELVRKTNSSYGTKGFSCWSQFVAMMFCQLGRANSLREICYGLATYLGKIRHLGLNKAPSRSSLSYANEHRPWQMYKELFYRLLVRCNSSIGEKHKFRFKNRLLSFDSTIISLCISIFDWAKYRRTKGAIKLHLLLDHAGYLPQFVHITEGKIHEVNVLKKIEFDPNTIIVIDRGLIDFVLFKKWTKNNIYFVTRLKKNADYELVERRDLPTNRNIIRDEIIRLKGFYSKEKCPYNLRIVETWVEEKKESIMLLTNHLEFGATTISQIYKDRWQIELFFKALKQNLRIKTFVGTSQNAVLIQIWTALISILILKYLKAKSKAKWSLSNLVAMLRYNLLTYRDLWEWINNPYLAPPEEIKVEQLSLLNLNIGQQNG
jgi:hypothetical protein